MNVTWQASTYCTRTVNSAVDHNLTVGRNEVLLDNQADISIIRPHLLVNVKQSDEEIRINGVGGLTLKVNKVGLLPDFFQVYSSEETLANVLSFSEVEDKYHITYVPQESFIVHLEDRDIEFKRRGKLYVAQWEEVATMLATVKEAEALYSEAEIDRAKEAYQLIKNSGYPSMTEIVRLIEDGNLVELPGITRAGIRRAYDVYGTPVEYVRGKMTHKKVSRERQDPALQESSKDQKLYSDVMHIDSQQFLISVCEPLQLTLQTPLPSESTTSLGYALQGQLQVLRSQGFNPTIVYTDPPEDFCHCARSSLVLLLTVVVLGTMLIKWMPKYVA